MPHNANFEPSTIIEFEWAFKLGLPKPGLYPQRVRHTIHQPHFFEHLKKLDENTDIHFYHLEKAINQINSISGATGAVFGYYNILNTNEDTSFAGLYNAIFGTNFGKISIFR